MALDVNRWFKYAKARIDRAVGQGNQSLDRLEAERQAELADRPWLRSDAASPTLDEARARIEWEAERQGRADESASPSAGVGAGAGSTDGTSSPTAGSLRDLAADAEQEAARLELAAREEASLARLEQIRAELGVDAPPAHPSPPPPADDGPSPDSPPPG